LYVDSGDSLALIAGIIIVLSIAVIANPGYLTGLQIPFSSTKPTPETVLQPEISGATAPVSQGQIPVTPALSEHHVLMDRITFTDKPYSYPSYRLPGNMETFGASELPAKTIEWVPFAFIEGTHGGLTEVFSVPYPVWVINSTVVARTWPQYSVFRMALCYAEDGGVIEGEEILNQGTSYRIVQTSNTDVYMIIGAENVDSFYIRLETPKSYYDAYSPAGS
jgi:hypothetical protein